ncbi:Beta-ketoacyl synthase [Moelleriella libera RCEF 2490]|uniref:Beta-ketoacyl synthase n=1 Tax=Moelleriella libera RCEF 2490 TaxID=1081109 RepID=A0A166NI50_9HYPO|nr:Beta-ketoacyl synthase [Moelleriella libera RCEF 2490]
MATSTVRFAHSFREQDHFAKKRRAGSRSALKSQEIGRDVKITDHETDFSVLGIDGLAAISVVESVSTSTGVDLPASLFRDCTNLSELADTLGQQTVIPYEPCKVIRDENLLAQAFWDVSKDVRQFAQDAGFATFWTRVYPSQRQLVIAYVLEAFASLGSSLAGLAVEADVIYPKGVLGKHRRVFDGAILGILEDSGLVSRTCSGTMVRTSAPINMPPAKQALDDLVRDHPAYAKIHRLLHVTGYRFADCVRGDADPIALLYGKDKALLQDFYTNVTMFMAASLHLAALVKRVFAKVRSSNSGHVVVIEIGAGFGGITKAVADALIQAQIPFKYTFTDVSSFFFAATKKWYQNLPKDSTMNYEVLDIEKKPPETLLRSLDMAIFTHCIRDTKDLAAPCSHVRDMLHPGGFFALIEFTSRLFWLDLVFGLLDGWWVFVDDRKHCAVEIASWKDICAGQASMTFCVRTGRWASIPQLLRAHTD